MPGLSFGQSAFGQAVTRTGIAITPANALASFRINLSGIAESAGTDNSFSTEYRWLTGAATNAFYWVRWTTTSGALSSGTAGTWLICSATNTWIRNRMNDLPGTTTVVGTLEIAVDSAGARIIATSTVTLNAEVLD